jgi:hypothetical protein
LSLSNLLRAFNSFREDYRRIQKIDSNWRTEMPSFS